MRKKQIVKKEEGTIVPVTVDNQRKELTEILPEAESGTVLATFQFGDTAIRIPIPFMPKESIKNLDIKNRSVFTIGPVKVGVDIV